MATLWQQDGGYVLLWQHYDNNKMADMCYYGNVMTTARWRICVTMATLWQQQDGGYMLFYIFNSTVIDWTCYNFFFGSVFLWIVQFHFLYLPPVFVPSYWQLHAFSTLSYKRNTTESVVDLVVLLWRLSPIVFYTRQQRRIWLATDSCWSSQPLLLRVRNVPDSVLGPASIMTGGGGVVSWIPSNPPGKCKDIACNCQHPFQFTAHAANFIHGLTH